MAGPRIFTAKITHSRLTWSPFSSESMLKIGEVTLDSILDRLFHAVNAHDAPAKPLTDRYVKRKMLKNRAPVRDWEFRGATKRSLKVKSANEDHATLGPVTREADLILSARRKDDMWGISPRDEQALRAVIRETLRTTKVVRVVKTKTA
jgi:hypothetical protein